MLYVTGLGFPSWWYGAANRPMPIGVALLVVALFMSVNVSGQSLGGVGTIKGLVADAMDLPIPSALVELSNRLTDFSKHTLTAADGTFAFDNIPRNTYWLRVSLAGFRPHSAVITIRTVIQIDLNIRLQVAGQQTSVTVEATSVNPIEKIPAPTNTVDRQLLAALPTTSPDAGLNDAVMFTTPNVASDSNGFFHPLGDHAQVSYVIDGQPVSDQRNKVFSTSIPANAIQSMEVISGSPSAEYGDKTSLVINAVTRSGLGQKPTGSIAGTSGSFGTIGEEATLGVGTARWGNFLLLNTERTGRFLDTPEFRPTHDIGNTGTVFDRIDLQPNGRDAFHLMAARNWLQVPNTYDQPRQDQKQKVVSFNIAPGYQHTIDAHTLLTLISFFRRDHVNYYPSRNAFDDSPATLSQNRALTNAGMHTDIARIQGRHNWKAGLNASQTRISEEFHLGISDPAYNGVGDLLPYDLTRGGTLYLFQGRATISQVSYYGQDTMTLGDVTLAIGLRVDHYKGLTRGDGVQPRGALSYLFKATQTLVRAGYSRTMETPINENLVASSSTGSGGLASNLFNGAAEQRPIALGRRNQYDAGIQQSLGKWILVDVSYFRKYTRNAFDFDALFSTPVTFPIGWKQSKLDGVGVRVSTPDIGGLRIYATLGHANARFFGPENGGIIFNSNLSIGAYRQDHDQVYQQNVNLHYQKTKLGWWADFTWRYDSGLVVGAVHNLEDALVLTADQQATIGLYCGGERASLAHRITACTSPDYGADRVTILGPGTENDDRNPPRTKSRHIFDVSLGTDNLLHTEHARTTVRFTIVNLSNKAALYNFLSPFSGTHWFEPRMFRAQVGWMF
jgi:Carboxypeptidase regulatory-like domain/TonB-dependent Receptor Plug Domain